MDNPKRDTVASSRKAPMSSSSDRIPLTVVHYGRTDPRVQTGGVETFARNLGLAFREVLFMTPASRDVDLVRRRKLVVICDNHTVLDWPDDVPVVGFQHGVAARKVLVTRSLGDLELAWLQRRAARRPRTLWVACAEWISDTFARLHRNRASHVVYHPVDLGRFDGRLDHEGSRLVLHDARSPHKGSRQLSVLSRALPDWRFEALACRPEEVPARMRKARAFVHLSRYEGNSIVCNEAMAMDLPCLFTRVGLMLDRRWDFDVQVLPPRVAFGAPRRLVHEVSTFLDTLGLREYHPRRWALEHASHEANLQSWSAVVEDFSQMSGWKPGESAA